MPGIGLEIEGAVQQAPQSARHGIKTLFVSRQEIAQYHLLPTDSKTLQILLPESPGAGTLTRYFLHLRKQDYCNAKSE